MSEDDEEEADPKPQDSKCWTCKFGLALHDKDKQSVLHPGTTNENQFESQEGEPTFNEISFMINKVRSICYWKPQGVRTLAPIIVNVVTECSRYET